VSLYLNIVQLIISITLIVIILLQVKGDNSGGVFGGAGIARSRRGLEATLFKVTIGLAALFLLVSFVSALGIGTQ
jgi:protein translocase SecG subunit